MAYVVTGYWDAGYTISDSEAKLASQLQKIAPGAIIELFQLELNAAQHGIDQTYYFHSGVDQSLIEITWAGQTYQPIPIEADGFEWNGQGSLPRPTLRASNALGTLTALILTLPDGLEGAKLTRIRTLGLYLDDLGVIGVIGDPLLLEDSFTLLLEDGSEFRQEAGNQEPDPYAEFPREIYYVDRKSLETRDVIEFELASVFDLAGVRAPKRQCVTRCQWEYRSAECGYSGSNYFDVNNNPVGNASQDVCGKQVDSCKARFGNKATLPHGGFPGIGTFFA
jgi:phage-related protein